MEFNELIRARFSCRALSDKGLLHETTVQQPQFCAKNTEAGVFKHRLLA